MEKPGELFDVLSELIYMRDMETYELVYINRSGAEVFHVPSNGDGRKCYEVLQGKEAPCDFCPHPHLSEEQMYIWEFYNQTVGRHYMLRDRIIGFNGRKVHMEIAFDVTEQRLQQNELERLSNINEISIRCVQELYRQPDLQQKIQKIVEIIGSSLEAERAYVFSIQGDTMSNTYEWCAEGIDPMIDSLQGLDIALMQRWMPTFSKHQCVVIESLEDVKESSPEEYRVLHMQGIHSLLAGPLWLDDKLIGYIGLDNPCKEKMQWGWRVFDRLGYFLVSTIQKYEDEERLHHLSFHDGLTGAQNRNCYMKKLDDLEGCTLQKVGVLFVDLNGLKRINDTQGHEQGDAALVATERAIEACFGEDAVYRVGGDEFVVLAYPVEETDFQWRVKEMKDRFAQHGDLHLAVGSQWEAQTEDVGALVDRADGLMYEDKQAFYRQDPLARINRPYNHGMVRVSDPDELHELISMDRFRVYLQPKVDLKNGKAVGAEALARYVDEAGNVFSPIDFIPMLEYTKMVHQVDLFMAEQVCAFLANRLEQNKRVVPVSVNLSRYTLVLPDIQERLEALLTRYQIAKNLLQLEITESGEVEISPEVMEMLQALQQSGMTICMDDFGVKQANLLLFSLVDFNVLKLDKDLLRTFRQNHKTRVLIHSIVDICRKLDIQLVVEGVETEEERQNLLLLDCAYGQGYLFDHPLPMAQFEAKYLDQEA